MNFIFNFRVIFYPQNYYTIVATDLKSCINQIYLQVKSNNDVSLKLFSQMYGKLCFLGHSGKSISKHKNILKSKFSSFFKDILNEKVLNNLIKNCYKDPLWIRIAQNLFNSIPFKYLEQSLWSLVKSAKK